MDTPSTVDAVRVGFASVSVDPGIQEQALDNLQRWLEDARFVMYRAQVDVDDRSPMLDGAVDSFAKSFLSELGGAEAGWGVVPIVSIRGPCLARFKRTPNGSKPRVERADCLWSLDTMCRCFRTSDGPLMRICRPPFMA